jgi:hypothetical protein
MPRKTDGGDSTRGRGSVARRQVDDVVGEPQHEMDLPAYIRVQVRKFFGRLAITEFSGLCDVSTGRTIGNRMVTGPFGRELEKTWTEIQNIDDLAIKAIMTFECLATYGDSPDDDSAVD